MKITELLQINEMKNEFGEVIYSSFGAWKRAAKIANPDVWFDGDADICNAMVGPKPYKRLETRAIGEWDGEQGVVFKSSVNEQQDVVKFFIDTERAYQAVMKKFGHVIEHDEDSGLMIAPRQHWAAIEQVAHDAGGSAEEEDYGLSSSEHYGVREENDVAEGAATFKSGDRVLVKNAKKYDSMAPAGQIAGVVDFVWPDGRIAVTVKNGASTGQMNVDAADLVTEGVITSILTDKLDQLAAGADEVEYKGKLYHRAGPKTPMDNPGEWKEVKKTTKELKHHVVSKLDGWVLASYATREQALKNAHGNPVVSGDLETIGDHKFVREAKDAEKLKAYKRLSAGDAINRRNIANRAGVEDPKIAKRNQGQERAEKRLQGIAKAKAKDEDDEYGQAAFEKWKKQKEYEAEYDLNVGDTVTIKSSRKKGKITAIKQGLVTVQLPGQTALHPENKGDTHVYEPSELIKEGEGVAGGSVYVTDSKMLTSKPDLPVTIHKSPYEGAEVGEYTEMFQSSPKTAQQFAKYIIFKGGSARLGKRGQDTYVYHKGAGPITKRDFRMAKIEESVGDPEEGWCVVSSDRPRIVIDGPHLDREDALDYKRSVSPAQSSGWFVLWGKPASDGSGEFVATRAVSPAGEIKEQDVAEAWLDPSGLHAAASMVRDFIITAEVDGKTKKFRIRGMTGPNAAKERFLKHANMAKVLDVKPAQDVVEGPEFGTYYYEKLAQQVFDKNPKLDTSGSADELLAAGFAITKQQMGDKRAQSVFSDEDFPSDFVSAYHELQQGVAEGSEMLWNVYRQISTTFPSGENDYQTEVVKTFNNDREAENYAYKLNVANRDDDVYYYARGKQGMAEGSDKAEQYKQHLLDTLPQMLKLFSSAVSGWKPSKEQLLAVVETGYTVMKHTGDLQQAGQAVKDELNILHRMSQGQQGMAKDIKEGFSEDDLAVGGTIIYKADEQYRMSKLAAKLVGRQLKLLNGAVIDLSDVVSSDQSDWSRFKGMRVVSGIKYPTEKIAEGSRWLRYKQQFTKWGVVPKSKKMFVTFFKPNEEQLAKDFAEKTDGQLIKVDQAGRQIKEMQEAHELGLDPDKRVVIKGVRGMKSTPFTKKFKNLAAYEAWLDSDEAGDYEIFAVMNESAETVASGSRSPFASHHEEAMYHLSHANDANAKGDDEMYHAHMMNYHESMADHATDKGDSASAEYHRERVAHHDDKISAHYPFEQDATPEPSAPVTEVKKELQLPVLVSVAGNSTLMCDGSNFILRSGGKRLAKMPVTSWQHILDAVKNRTSATTDEGYSVSPKGDSYTISDSSGTVLVELTASDMDKLAEDSKKHFDAMNA